MNSRPVVIKWKYRINHPEQKDSINGYVEYISSQVKERRNGTGRFEANVLKDTFGLSPDIDEGSSTSEIERYISYMDSRAGSYLLFTSNGTNISETVEEIKAHAGTMWIPIVSLKEEWAKEFGLTGEVEWMIKGRELAEIYRKELGIKEDNFGWVAAFHTKPEVSQNENADAGCQPHLHFILYEKCPDPKRSPTIRHKKLEEIHSKTASVLSREYMKISYEKRNELRKEITSKSERLDEVVDDVHALLWDIHTLTKGKGKLSVGEFEHAAIVMDSLHSALSQNQKLTREQEFYAKQLDIREPKDAARAMHMYLELLDHLEKITDRLLESEDAKELLEQWKEVSDSMRSAQGFEKSALETSKDLEALKRQMQNSILKQTRNLSSQSRFITKKFKGMLLEKMELGSFRQGAKISDIMDATRVISSLLKECGVSKDEARKQLNRLLETTEEERKRKLAMAELDRIYRKVEVGMDVSTIDFWNTMKVIQMEGSVSSIYSPSINSSSLSSAILLEPVAKSSLRALENHASVFHMDEPSTVLSLSLSSLTHVPLTREEYIAKYEALLEAYETYCQEYRNERSLIHEEEIGD